MHPTAPVILVRAPNWLGDTVMALPALSSLREAMPRARITLTGRWAALLAGQGVADVLLAYPSRAGERRRFNHALAKEGADLAILFPNSFEAALAARRWRARRRIGFDSDGRRPLLTDAIPLPSPRRHQVDEYAALLEPLGVAAAATPPAFKLGANPVADTEIDALLDAAGASGGARLVGLHLGAAFGPSKLWAPESFARLAGRLAGAALSPVLLGSEADRDTAAAVVAACRRPPASLVGRDRPALLPRLLSRLACLVSGDTGVAHLAAALGVPTVTLFGPTDPGLTGPRGASARVIRHAVACSPCFLASCPIEHLCLGGIEAEEVEREVRRVAAA
jgi:heptosyltransferase-2